MKRFLSALVIFGFASTSWSAPVPTAVTGSVAAGQTLTISGSSFGAMGPNIVLMEDFERDIAGQKVVLAGAPVGAWTGYNSSNTFLASPNAHTGNVGFHAYDYAGQGANILNLALGAQYQEIFISYWVTIPAGKTFPGMWGPTGAAPPPVAGQFSNDSSWKLSWILQTSSMVATQFNMIPLSYAGSNQFTPTQSDSNYAMFIQPGNYWENSNNISTSWWSWIGWNRISTWMRGNSTVPIGAIGGFIQTLNVQNGMFTWNFGNPVTYPTSAMFQKGVPQYFTQVNVPGWVRENSGPNADPTYDDIYVAVGPGSAARAEITDAATYATSKHSTLLRPTAWSTGQITATVPKSGLDFTGAAYLYVTDLTGATNAAGLSIGTVGAVSPPICTCP
jgi:hypothetical protein